MRTRATLGIVGLAAVLSVDGVLAADYPVKPIRILVPFAPGASGLVSRRPVRGEDAGTAGFYRVAATTSQTYPTKPIRIIVPFAPGGPTDVIGRLLSVRLTEAWGQQVVIDNRGGAGGNIGMGLGAHANPDGYTWLMVSSSFVVIRRYTRRFRTILIATSSRFPIWRLRRTRSFCIPRRRSSRSRN